MGTWGSGNLDSDGALDCIGELSTELISTVWTLMQSKASTEADESEYDELFARLEWLFAVDASGAFNGWTLPAVAEVEPVLATWFDAWGVYFDGLSGPEFKAERGAVILASFQRFNAICATWAAKRET